MYFIVLKNSIAINKIFKKKWLCAGTFSLSRHLYYKHINYIKMKQYKIQCSIYNCSKFSFETLILLTRLLHLHIRWTQLRSSSGHSMVFPPPTYRLVVVPMAAISRSPRTNKSGNQLNKFQMKS